MMRKPMLTLLLCATLAACKTAPTMSIAPSLAPVHTLIPTVDCGEDVPDAQLPDYPVGPPVRRNDVDPRLSTLSRDQLATAAAQLYDYSQSQQQWGIRAAGVVADEHTLRQHTRTCLDGLRTRGLIN